MRVLISLLIILAVAATIVIAGPPQQADPLPEVYAEALGSANLRSGAGIEFELVGEILAGTPYRVVRQHASVPWLLLEVPGSPRGAGWVFADLISVTQGSLASVPFETTFDEIPLTGLAYLQNQDTPSPTQNTAPPPSSDAEATAPTPSLTPSPSPTLAPNLTTATLIGRSNIRYAPGIDYPVIATFDEGTVLTVMATHSAFDWYRVAVEGSATGDGWVFAEVVQIDGDLAALPVETATTFAFPTPTATPDAVVVVPPPFDNFGVDSPRLAEELGEPIHEFLLENDLAPRTDREGSVFVMDLLTGEHFTLNGGVAYSGMSIMKIPVLVSYFIDRDRGLELPDAELVANTMICSENTSTNQMMTILGDGDILAGAREVSANMQQLGLGNSYVVAPFFTGNPEATPAPVSPINTAADQRTQPDLFNQMTVEEIGWLLGSMYQCAADGSGPLTTSFPNRVTQLECQQMIRVMSGNKIGRLLEAGTPIDTTIAHKHGWINNTHGDAGIVFGDESAYVLAMVYHERSDWLDFERSFPLLEELSRRVWNYFNPSQPLEQTVSAEVPEVCNIYGETVIDDLLSGNVQLPTPQITPEPAQDDSGAKAPSEPLISPTPPS